MNCFELELLGIFGHKTTPKKDELMSNFKPPKRGIAIKIQIYEYGASFLQTLKYNKQRLT